MGGGIRGGEMAYDYNNYDNINELSIGEKILLSIFVIITLSIISIYLIGVAIYKFYKGEDA